MNRPLGLALAIAAAFGVWEILFAGFMADDLMQLGILEGVSPAAAWTSRFDLYTISDGDPAHVRIMQDAGLFPWFMDPNFEMTFFRPLSSALLTADHALFGLHPTGYRLHGVLWSMVLVAAAGAVLHRALPGRTGTIALLLFVMSGIHAIFVWNATRHVVIAAALGFTALAAHLAWRESGWRPGAVLSVLALTLALCASEVGVAVALYLLAYETLGAYGDARARVRAAAPTVILVGTYLFLWRLFGHGASPGTGYIDALRDPGPFLVELPGRLAVLLGGVVSGGNVDLWVLRPDLRPTLIVAGAAATLFLAVLLRAAWHDASTVERRAVRWLGIGAVASAVPFAGTPIGSRCLIVPFVGGAALLALVISRWWTVWRQRNGWRFRILGVASAALAVIHLGLAPIGRLGLPVLLQRGMTERAAATWRDAELDPATLPAQTAVVLVAPDLVVGLHGSFYRLLHRLPMPAASHVLSWAAAEHRFKRTGEDTLEMEVAGGGIERMTLAPGTIVTAGGMRATVLSTAALGQLRVRFRFDRSLDAPSLTLLAWRDGRLRRVEAPPVGGAIVIPFAPLS